MRVVCTIIGLIASVAATAGGAEWIRTIGTDTFDEAVSVQTGTDGSIIVAGNTMETSAGDADIWVAKLDPSGSTVWQRTYGGQKGDWANSIRCLSGGGYMVVGDSSSFRHRGTDAWVLRLDSRGDVKWQTVFNAGPYDYAYDSVSVEDGYLVVGSSRSTGPSRDWNGFVIKLDRRGTVLWWKEYGGLGSDELQSIVRAQDGGLVVAGRTQSVGGGVADAWVLGLDRHGKILWQKTYGGGDWDSAETLVRCQGGGYLFVGATVQAARRGAYVTLPWAVRLDESGGVIWQRAYAGVSLSSVRQSADGGYLVGGNILTHAGLDAWLARLDSEGWITWQKRYGGLQGDTVLHLTVGGDGTCITVGWTESFGAGGVDGLLLRVLPTGGLPAPCADYSLDTNATVQVIASPSTESSALAQDVGLRGEVTNGVTRKYPAANTLICGSQQ